MAEDDIYGNKARYEYFTRNLVDILSPPQKGASKRKYFCKNKANLIYFHKLFDYFDLKDLSFVRRLRILVTMKAVVHVIENDISMACRDDVNKVVIHLHKTNLSISSKKTFIRDIKLIWRVLFPEFDDRGRIDETLTPYAVRHLSCKIDKSKQKIRTDKITIEEYHRIIDYFAHDPRIQAFLTITFEWLVRPQELLYTKIKNIEFHENYAKIYIGEHGKEGIKFIASVDSYPYLLRWLEVHPYRSDKESYIFVNTGNTGAGRQLSPFNINKKLKKACKDLSICKPLTCYSFKRNGVTHAKKNGDTEVEIQHKAGWTSTKPLKIYDLTTQDDAFEVTLKKRGLISNESPEGDTKPRVCRFCNEPAGFSDVMCRKCRRPLDSKIVKSEMAKDQTIINLKKENSELKDILGKFKEEIVQELTAQILKAKSEGAQIEHT